ncbi:UNVERIFIED_CONTAM: hypothetical protein GTU68_060403 [Idotea baltica]|nr:hypothetical protein [Idotea baltica]
MSNNWRLLLTRSDQENHATKESLHKVDFWGSSFPLLDITLLPELPEHRDFILQLNNYSAVIVVSKNAARLGLDLIKRYWDQAAIKVPWFTVGPATAHILIQADLNVFYSNLADNSEALWNLPLFQEKIAARGAKVLILKGSTGREFLANHLEELGVTVDSMSLYRHDPSKAFKEDLIEKVNNEHLNGIVVSSGQSFNQLCKLAGANWLELCEMPLFVPSARVAHMAKTANARHVINCCGAGTAALLAALHENSVTMLRRKGKIHE